MDADTTSDDSKDDDESDPEESAYLERILDGLDLDREVNMDESRPAVTTTEAKVACFAIFKIDLRTLVFESLDV